MGNIVAQIVLLYMGGLCSKIFVMLWFKSPKITQDYILHVHIIFISLLYSISIKLPSG